MCLCCSNNTSRPRNSRKQAHRPQPRRGMQLRGAKEQNAQLCEAIICQSVLEMNPTTRAQSQLEPLPFVVARLAVQQILHLASAQLEKRTRTTYIPASTTNLQASNKQAVDNVCTCVCVLEHARAIDRQRNQGLALPADVPGIHHEVWQTGEVPYAGIYIRLVYSITPTIYTRSARALLRSSYA
jgi:hypothetical protein